MKTFRFTIFSSLLIVLTFLHLSTAFGQTFTMKDTTVTTCTGTLYDTGGPAGDYGNDEDSTFVINVPGNSGIRLIITAFNTQATQDVLTIYNGPNNTFSVLRSHSGTITLPDTIYTDSSVVTINFSSNAATVAAGFEIQWDANITPNVSLSASANPICAGDPITFTVTDSSNAGDPVFTWTLNSAPAPGASDLFTYTNASLVNDDTIRVIMMAEMPGCYTNTADTAEVVIVANPPVAPNVTMTASANPVCPGDPVTFTVTDSTNAGNPDFTWTINSAPAPGASNLFYYTSSSLANDDTIRVVMKAQMPGCYIDSLDIAQVIITINAATLPSVSMTASTLSECAGKNVTFTVTDSTNGGANPSFQWQRNGVNVGTDLYTYSNASLTDNDVIRVIMTANPPSCIATTMDTASVTMNINPKPNVVIGSFVNLACNGIDTGSATANGTGGTGALTYAWSPGGQSTATATNLSPGAYQVILTDDSTCSDTATVTITEPTAITTTSINVTNVSSFGGSDGALGGHFSGGTVAVDYSYSWNTTPVQTTDSISNLISRWYIVTVRDDNNCTHVDSAFVSQPDLLLGGTIEVSGGGATKTVCDGVNVGRFIQTAPSMGGTGSNVYTWQYSTNLINWINIASSDSITSFTYNVTITADRFIRRRVVDAASDSAFSNIIFVDYIAPLNLGIVGLNSTYCKNSPNVTMTGVPAGPGGTFLASAYVSGSVFSPANAVGGGTSNTVSYRYTDANGCTTQFDQGVIVNDTTPINFPINTFYTPTSQKDTLVGTPPGGVFSGLGVSQIDSVTYVFDPTVPPTGVTFNITYTLTNVNNCTSVRKKPTSIQNNTVTLTGFQADKTYCIYDPTHVVNVNLGGTPPTIIIDTFFVRNVTRGITFTPVELNTAPANSFVFDPAAYGAGTPGVYDLIVRYKYGVVTFPTISFTEVDVPVKLVNTGSAATVKISSEEDNSNGSTAPPFRFCENLNGLPMVGTHPNFGVFSTINTFNITSGIGLSHSNNSDTAFLNPSNPSIASSGTITYTFTDSASGCFTTVAENYSIDTLPVVTITGIDEVNGYCANSGKINFAGLPYADDQFTYNGNLFVSWGTKLPTASFDANASNIGLRYITYTYTEAATGCTNKDSVSFRIDTLPNLSIVIDTPNVVFLPPGPRASVCVSNTNLSLTGLIAGLFAPGQGNFFGPGVTDNNNTSSYFNGNVAGVMGSPGHEIFYRFTDGNGCSDTISTEIRVNDLPNPAFEVPSTPENKKFVCVVNDPIAMRPLFNLLPDETDTYVLKSGAMTFPLAGGDSIYNPLTQTGTAGPGNTDTIMRIVTNNVTGCVATALDYIQINPNPVPSITVDSASYCANEGNVVFNFSPPSEGTHGLSTSPQGGYLIVNKVDINLGGGNISSSEPAPGISSGSFNTNSVTGNQVIVTYTHTDSITGCKAIVRDTTPIVSLPVLTLSDFVPIPTGVYCYGLTGTVSGNLLSNPSPIRIDTMRGFGNTIINPVFPDSTFTFSTSIPSFSYDTIVDSVITYKYHDNVTGCYNYTNKTVKIRRVPFIDFDLEDQGKDVALCITDISDVKVANLVPPTLKPGASRQFILNGKQTLGGQTFKPFVDSADIGFNYVKYIHTDQYQCKDSLVDSIEIFATPVASFIDPSLCFVDSITFMSTSTIHPSTTIDTSIWEFGDTQKDTSYTNSITHKYTLPGLRNILLTEISAEGCRSQVGRPLTFGQPPKAEFTWPRIDECGDTVHIINQSDANGGVASNMTYTWDFNDGTPIDTNENPVHGFSGTTQAHLIRLIANISDCVDTLHHIFARRPSISTYPYTQNFESGKGGWEFEYDYDNDDIDTGTWAFGTPAKNHISGAHSGANAWVTGINTDYRIEDTTYVTSPCFDFSDLERPMIIVWLNYKMDPNDGVVLQYTTDNGTNVNWHKLGDTPKNGYASGQNWYTKDGIAASPGKQTASERNVGWTDSTTNKWMEARHRLDELAGQPYVRLRFAIGSGPNNVSEGFAFDDIWIGERKKNVLFESFGNTNTASSKDANDQINPIVRNNSKDVLNVQYHTSFPGQDPLNYDNQADPSARLLYYSISEIPYFVVDGNYYKKTAVNFYQEVLQLRALKDPEFTIDMKTAKNGNQLNIQSTIYAHRAALDKLENPDPNDVTLHFVVTEDSIHASQLVGATIANGETHFLNTVKRMVPTAAGTNYTHGWRNGETETVNFSVNLNTFKGGDNDWKVVAFVQDNKTKEVYQAVFNNSNNPTTGIGSPNATAANGFDFILYPNPSSGIVNFMFNQSLESRYSLMVINQLGAVVSNEQLSTGITGYELNAENLPDGMYYIVLTNTNGERTTRKLLIAR